MRNVEGLLAGVSAAWQLETRPTLHIIGCTALVLQTNYDRGTRDSDVLETHELDAASKAHLLELAGPHTVLARRWASYVEVVANGIPFLPRPATWRRLSLRGVTKFQVEVLDVVDVVVSKLKRFHTNDRADIDAMVERGLVTHESLVQRFRNAADVWADGANGPPSEVDLPDRLDD